MASQAITGDLSIITSDGTELAAHNDLALAWKWAEHEHGPAAWANLTYGAKCASVADALAELRRAYGS
jgi:hypothetical protein